MLKLILLSLFILFFSACGSNTTKSSSYESDIPPNTQEPTDGSCGYSYLNHSYLGLNGDWFEDETFCKEMVTEAEAMSKPCYGTKEELNEFITYEYCRNFGLTMMNTSSAYLKGITGNGVIVAVLDSKVDDNHSEFAHNLSSNSKVYIASSKDSPHGTSVAGIIASAKNDDLSTVYSDGMQGVAYNSEILSLAISGSDGQGDGYDLLNSINYATENGAKVINLSSGSYMKSSNVEYKQSFIEAIASDVTIVMSAGNENQNCSDINLNCVFPASLPFLDGYEELLNGDGGWIIVGAVDSKSESAYFSNKAGVTKSHYVVAFGVDSYSVKLGGGYSRVDGTSISTPHVSGVVALMKEAFPHLSGKQITDVIFETCTDLGEKGVDDVYGHGLVNVKKAFELAETL